MQKLTERHIPSHVGGESGEVLLVASPKANIALLGRDKSELFKLIIIHLDQSEVLPIEIGRKWQIGGGLKAGSLQFKKDGYCAVLVGYSPGRPELEWDPSRDEYYRRVEYVRFTER